MTCSRFRLSAVLVFSSALCFSVSSRAEFYDDPLLVVMRGRAVCLDEKGQRIDPLFECNAGRFGFVDKDSKLYPFIANDSASVVFTDGRVRKLELQITARLHSRDELELIRFQSVREGKLYDLYYFCEVCNIRAYAPGLCPCCRDELELRETPLSN